MSLGLERGSVDLWKAGDVAGGKGLRLRTRRCAGGEAGPGLGGKPFSAEGAREAYATRLWESRQPHRNACTKLWMSLSNSGSCFRRSSIFRIEWMTVE